MTSIDRALDLARAGFRVFPLKPGQKTPAVPGWQNFATTDPDALREWWGGADWRVYANIGVAGGPFGSNGRNLVIMDVDNKNGKNGSSTLADLEREHGPLPATVTAITPTGGFHLYFLSSGPVGNSVEKLGPGLDVRGMGGYVVAPGSIIGGNRYEWEEGRSPADMPVAECPEAWVQALRGTAKPKEGPTPEPAVSLDDPGDIFRALAYLEREAPTATEGAHGDQTTFAVAARLKDFGVSETDALDLLLNNWNERCSPPWEPEDLARKVANAYRYGREAPGVSSPRADFTPIVQGAPAPARSEPEGRRLRFERFDNIKPDLDRRALVDGWLHPGAFSVMYGDANTGKTNIALDMAIRVAADLPWFGRSVQQGPVAYIAAEGGGGIRARVAAFRQHLGHGDVPFYLLADSVDLLDPRGDVLPLVKALKEIEAETGQGVALLIVDTLARALAGGNENAGEDMGGLIRNVDHVRAATGAHVLLIHHSGKDQARGARGHSSLRAAVDTELEVQKTGPNTGTVRATKQRDMELGAAEGFRLVPVQVGTGPDGALAFSCVVEHQDIGAARDFGKKEVKPGSRAAEALDILRELVKERGDYETGIFDGPTVPLNWWREECCNRRLAKGTGNRCQEVAFWRAKELLLKHRQIEISQDLVGVAP